MSIYYFDYLNFFNKRNEKCPGTIHPTTNVGVGALIAGRCVFAHYFTNDLFSLSQFLSNILLNCVCIIYCSFLSEWPSRLQLVTR